MERFWTKAAFQGLIKEELPSYGPAERLGAQGAHAITSGIHGESRISFIVEGIRFVVDPGLLDVIGRGSLRAWIREAISEALVLRADPFPAELKSLSGRTITLALLDRSTHLLEHHPVGQGSVIGINRALFDRVSSGDARAALFAMGLTHELRHAAGKAKTEDSEKELSREDARFLRSMVPPEQRERTLAELSGILQPDSLFLFELEKLHADHVWGDSSRGIFNAEIDPGGGRVATAGWDGKIRLWNRRGQILERLPNRHGTAMAFDHGRGRLAVGGADGSVHILEHGKESPGALTAPVTGRKDEVRSLSFSPDDWLIAAGGDSGLVRVWDLEDRRLLAQLPHEGPILSLAFSPDGLSLATVDRRGQVRLWDVGLGLARPIKRGASFQKEKEVPERGFEDASYGVAFSPDSRWLAASGPGGHVIRVWDTGTGSIERTLTGVDNAQWVSRLVFSDDGRLLASADLNGEVQVWERVSGRLLLRHRFEDSVVALRFEPRTRILIVFDRDGNLTDIEIPKG